MSCYETVNAIREAYFKPGDWAVFGERVGAILHDAGLDVRDEPT